VGVSDPTSFILYTKKESKESGEPDAYSATTACYALYIIYLIKDGESEKASVCDPWLFRFPELGLFPPLVSLLLVSFAFTQPHAQQYTRQARTSCNLPVYTQWRPPTNTPKKTQEQEEQEEETPRNVGGRIDF
jgi:hypothetical protein